MGSTISRAQVRSLVIGVIRADLGGQVPVREISRLGEDLGISSDRRAGYLIAISNALADLGLSLNQLGEDDFRGVNRVAEIVDMVLLDIRTPAMPERKAS